MALQPYVHVETLEQYSERFKDFAHLERTDDGILLCRLHWRGETPVWSYQAQNAYGELWTALGHDKKNEIIILTCQVPIGSCSAATPRPSTRWRIPPTRTSSTTATCPTP